MTLESQLAERRKKSYASEAIRNQIEGWEKNGLNALKVGDTAPDFELSNVDGENVRLSDILAEGVAIVTFYRGGWCPYCNMMLHAYQMMLPQYQELGANLIAISPQLPDNSLSTAEKNELQFKVLSDVGNQVARQFGLVVRMTDEVIAKYLQDGTDLVQINGIDTWELPAAGTFVIDRDRAVKYAFVSVDYTRRAEPSDILEALQVLKG